MSDAELLRQLGVNDPRAFAALEMKDDWGLDPRALALVRLGAMMAMSASDPSLRAQVDEAVTAGASDAEIVGVLAGIVNVIGRPRAVSMAPKLLVALGCESVFGDPDVL